MICVHKKLYSFALFGSCAEEKKNRGCPVDRWSTIKQFFSLTPLCSFVRSTNLTKATDDGVSEKGVLFFLLFSAILGIWIFFGAAEGR